MPTPRHYPPLAELERATQWECERVIAAGARFLGYEYQHHHIPDWDPPAGWPWKEAILAGCNGKGVDCSNFTSFVYNQGFGIRISSGIGRQARTDHAIFAGHPVPVKRIELPRDYRARQEALQTGDLLYIRHREGGDVSHVVIWVGSVGQAESQLPLVMDSHGVGREGRRGCADPLRHSIAPVPAGFVVRPLREPRASHFRLNQGARPVTELPIAALTSATHGGAEACPRAGPRGCFSRRDRKRAIFGHGRAPQAIRCRPPQECLGCPARQGWSPSVAGRVFGKIGHSCAAMGNLAFCGGDLFVHAASTIPNRKETDR